jgi:hypothetical protein
LVLNQRKGVIVFICGSLGGVCFLADILLVLEFSWIEIVS